jgi:hypothetical protein
MAWVLRLVETGVDGPARIIDVMGIRLLGALGDIANLGLTLADAKQILACLQQVVVSVQDHAGPTSGMLFLRSNLSYQGLAASSDGDAVGFGGGAASAISLRRLWSWRDGYQLAVVLPVHARARPSASTCFCSNAVSRRRRPAGAGSSRRGRNEPGDAMRPHVESW